MGFDCGFDVYPRLEVNAANKQAYQEFLDEVISRYDGVYDDQGRRADGKVLLLPNDHRYSHDLGQGFVWLMVGECPHLPSSADWCNYFLRFSSKVSGRLTTQAEQYIRGVHDIAKKHFGSRVRFWHEMDGTGDERQFGFYDWREVQEADKELRELVLQSSSNESCDKRT